MSTGPGKSGPVTRELLKYQGPRYMLVIIDPKESPAAQVPGNS